jgi:predicted acyltransferase
MFGHAVVRSLILIFLGIFLRSIGHSQTRYTFEDTLTQIGLGYTFLFLLAFVTRAAQWWSLSAILIGYWAAFALYPLPSSQFDWAQTGVTPDWPHHLQGFAAHWNKNTNLAWAFDRWFLNLFPRETPFLFNGGGYSTLSFIPTLGTMLLGLIAGGWLQDSRLTARDRLLRLVATGSGLLLAGYLLGLAGICPVVKRIWTPSWTLFSGGWCLLGMAAFYQVLDVGRLSRAWVFPLLVLGANSIAAYSLDHLCGGFIRRSLATHLGQATFAGPWGQFLQGVLVLSILWLGLYWLYRRKIFIRI